jgi:hypothetical protein
MPAPRGVTFLHAAVREQKKGCFMAHVDRRRTPRVHDDTFAVAKNRYACGPGVRRKVLDVMFKPGADHFLCQ